MRIITSIASSAFIDATPENFLSNSRNYGTRTTQQSIFTFLVAMLVCRARRKATTLMLLTRRFEFRSDRSPRFRYFARRAQLVDMLARLFMPFPDVSIARHVIGAGHSIFSTYYHFSVLIIAFVEDTRMQRSRFLRLAVTRWCEMPDSDFSRDFAMALVGVTAVSASARIERLRVVAHISVAATIIASQSCFMIDYMISLASPGHISAAFIESLSPRDAISWIVMLEVDGIIYLFSFKPATIVEFYIFMFSSHRFNTRRFDDYCRSRIYCSATVDYHYSLSSSTGRNRLL